MNDSELRRNPVEELADDFLRRYRLGERPSISEYALKHPELADEIRDVFPTLALVEQAGDAEAGVGAIADDALPTTLGEYQILREVGRGGMGVVYEAVQQSLGRHVALKVLSRESATNGVRLERFRREARSAARLHHTNIVPVFDVGSHRGSYFYAMQFIQGESLAAVLVELVRLRGRASTVEMIDPRATLRLATALASGQFNLSASEAIQAQAVSPVARTQPSAVSFPTHAAPDTPIQSELTSSSIGGGSTEFTTQSNTPFYHSVARIGLQVAEALAYAHEHGVLHRDIKPANLLLDHQGNVWVTDFGLAKDDDDALTEAGDLVGTLRYMSPERFDGLADARSDLYGLGMTLYELIALRPAFCESDRGKLIKRISQDAPSRLSTYDRRVPLDLETIVMKCIARRRDERYTSAAAMADDLRRFLSDRPIQARPATPLEKVWRWCRRNPAVASLTAAVWMLLAAIAMGATVSSVWLSQEQTATEKQLGLTEKAETRAEQRLFEALVAQARAMRRSGQPGRRGDSLAALAEAVKLQPDRHLDKATLRTLRSEFMAASALPDLKRVKSFTFESPWIGAAAVDCEAERYAVSDPAGGLHVVGISDGREIYRLSAAGICSEPRFAPDGRSLLAAVYEQGKMSLAMWSFDRSEAPPLVAHQGPFVTATFSPDGRQMAFATGDKTIHIWDVDAKRQFRELGPVPLPRHLAFRPDGKQIALTSNELRGVQVYDLETGQLAKSWPQDDAGCQVAWRGDGRMLAGSADDCQIYVWDTLDDRLLSILHGHRVGMVRVWFSKDGTTLISSAWDGSTRLWDPVTGQELMRMPGGDVGHSGRPSDRFLFASGWTPSHMRENAEIWEFFSAPALRTIHHGLVGNRSQPRGWVMCASGSQEGRLLATASFDGVRLWDLRRSTELAHLPMPSGASVSLFNPQRDELVTYSSVGVWIWPYAFDASSKGKIRMGPPRSLCHPDFLPDAGWALSHDGGSLLVAEPRQQQATLFRLTDPNQPITLGLHPAVRQVSLSPDGRWAATAPWHGLSIKIWDTVSGQQIREEIPCFDGFVRFSPDGQWLATGDESGARLWEVATWQPRPAISSSAQGTMAFSPDSRLLALTKPANAPIRLVEVASGAELATLESPDAVNFCNLNFSRDGSRLLATTLANTVHVWNLRLLREKLASLGLDWQQPSYPPEPADDGPIELEIDWGSFPRTASGP